VEVGEGDHSHEAALLCHGEAQVLRRVHEVDHLPHRGVGGDRHHRARHDVADLDVLQEERVLDGGRFLGGPDVDEKGYQDQDWREEEHPDYPEDDGECLPHGCRYPGRIGERHADREDRPQNAPPVHGECRQEVEREQGDVQQPEVGEGKDQETGKRPAGNGGIDGIHEDDEEEARGEARQRSDESHREFDAGIGRAVLHGGDPPEDEERDAVDGHPLALCNDAVRDLVEEDSAKEAERHESAEDIPVYRWQEVRRIDRDSECRGEHGNGEGHLGADYPCEDRDDEEECPVDQDRNAINRPDFERRFHKRSIFLTIIVYTFHD